jgi:hypothetical protein
MSPLNFNEKIAYPLHLLKKRLAIRRLDPYRIWPHQTVEDFHRLAIQA